MTDIKPTEPITMIDRKEFLHTYRVGALVPLMQSTITAIIVGVATYMIVYAADWSMYPEKPAMITSALAWMATWLSLHRHWFTLTSLEPIIKMDINGDGKIGAAPVAPEEPARPEVRTVTRIQLDEVKSNGHIGTTKIIDLPIDETLLASLAAGLLGGAPFSERFWTTNGSGFTSASFRATRAEMLKRGLVELINDKDPRQGYRLTAAGRGIMRHYVNRSNPTPSPTEEED